jgi:hypothetical protein
LTEIKPKNQNKMAEWTKNKEQRERDQEEVMEMEYDKSK